MARSSAIISASVWTALPVISTISREAERLAVLSSPSAVVRRRYSAGRRFTAPVVSATDAAAPATSWACWVAAPPPAAGLCVRRWRAGW